MTSKQRAYLRSLANTMKCTLYIGQGGIDDQTISEAYSILEARELMKAQVRAENITAKEACEKLCEALGCEPIQVIGNRFVVYREAREKKRYAEILASL
jgi:RNA-binding protein